MPDELLTTWDGLPISPEPPFGTTIVVYRNAKQGIEYLLLHRAHDGAAYEGEWAWTPPSGARLPGEPVDLCAQRELLEETGLTLPLHATGHGVDSWAIYFAEATNGDTVTLDAEHDRYEWVSLEVALERCLPVVVADAVAYVAQRLQSQDLT